MDSTTRFKPFYRSLRYYYAEVIVHCPKCGARARIVQKDGYRSNPILKCPNCHYKQSEVTRTYTQIVKLICSNCGERIHSRITGVAHKKPTIFVKCSNCQVSQKCEPRYREEDIVRRYGAPFDPHYGYQLWLAVEVRGNILWAYNYQHLNDIKQYVTASLREKRGCGYMTMVEKLPQWIISRKNRNEVLRAIAKLERA